MTATRNELVTSDGEVKLLASQLGPPEPHEVQVKTQFSGISAGTELLMIRQATGKAGQRYRLGYQLSGVVEAVGDDMLQRYSVGDLVACYGGPYVHHASMINAPRRLVTRLQPDVSLRDASFCGLGAIALHAFRCGNLAIGETAAVIGLGLLGNFVAQIAVAAGCRVAAIDPLVNRRGAAAESGIPVLENMSELACKVHGLTDGHYADAVYVAAGNIGDDLLRDAVRLCRENGRVVILGTSSAHIPREELFAKEVSVVVSRAAGPGRYDLNYEQLGYDYPYAQVRWTEHRNLEEFARLLGQRLVKVDGLITDVLKPEDAATAYEMLRESPDDHLGVALSW